MVAQLTLVEHPGRAELLDQPGAEHLGGVVDVLHAVGPLPRAGLNSSRCHLRPMPGSQGQIGARRAGHAGTRTG